MFTGIVEEKGSVRYMQLTGESGVLAVKAKKVLERTKIGDSTLRENYLRTEQL